MEPHLFSFEKLEVWQLARKLTIDIYKRTMLFPVEEKYSLVSQMRRSAASVAANIAEGSARLSRTEQARFSSIAYGSLMELFNHLIIAADLQYIDERELSFYKQRVQVLSVKISNLKASQLKRPAKPSGKE